MLLRHSTRTEPKASERSARYSANYQIPGPGPVDDHHINLCHLYPALGYLLQAASHQY